MPRVLSYVSLCKVVYPVNINSKINFINQHRLNYTLLLSTRSEASSFKIGKSFDFFGYILLLFPAADLSLIENKSIFFFNLQAIDAWFLSGL